MFRLLFIDEEKDAFDDFKDYVDDSPLKGEFEIITEFPLDDLDEMVESIFKINPDAIITDFMLNEHKTDISYVVPYDGAKLVERFTSIRNKFPCFILTSFDDHAVNQSEDVNIVYIKNILHDSRAESKAKATFLERVKSQIIRYQTRIHDAEERIFELIAKREAGKASIAEEDELIELDQFLESTVDRKSSIPKEYKALSNTKRLGQLLSKVDDVLKKVDSKDDE